MFCTQPQAKRYCHALIGRSLTLLTIGTGYLIVFDTTLADILVIMAGLGLGWVAVLYCLGNADFWGSLPRGYFYSPPKGDI